jgi:myosin heavy subunit
MGQLTKAYNEMKSSSDTSPLEGLFGKTDLTGVIEQLNSIVIKLDEISTAITNIDFSKLSINSSNDGVSELTEKIKSLETELQTVKAEYASMKDAFQGGETSDNGESRLETANKLLDQQIQSLVQIKTLQTQISNASKNGEDTTKLENDLTLEKDKYTTLNNQLSAYDDIIPKLERQKALIEQASEIYSNKHKEESSALLKEQIENLNKIYELQAKIKVESSKKNSSTTALEDELKTRQENACQLKVESEQYNDIITQAERLAEITKGTNQARLKLQDVSNSKAAEQEAKALSDQAKLIEQLNSAYDKYSGRDASSQSDRYKELLSQLTQAKTIVDSLNGKTIDNMTDKELSDWQYAVKLFSSASAELGKMSSSEMGSSDSQRSKLLLRISEYMEKNTVAAKEYRAEFQALIDEINQKGANANVQELTTKFNKLKTSISDASKTGKSFMDVLKDKVWYGWAAQIASMYLSIYRLIGYLKTGISTIIDLDTALVDLKKTTTMNSSELDTFYYNSNEVAKQMGTTTEEIISQASAWSRLNKIGLLYSNV